MWASHISKVFEPTWIFAPLVRGKAMPVSPHAITGFNVGVARIQKGRGELVQPVYAERLRGPDIQNFEKLGWLKHVAASGRSLYAVYAMGLLREWQSAAQPRLEKRSAADALFALSVDGPVVASLAPSATEFLFSLVQPQIKKVLAFHARSTDDRLMKGVALLSAHLAFKGQSHVLKAGLPALETSLMELVLTDGGVQSRRAEDLAGLLSLLMPLRSAFVAAHEVVPEFLHQAIERMVPMLRLLTLGDGEIAGFARQRFLQDEVSRLLAEDETGAAPLILAPYAGYARLEIAETVIVADTAELALPLSFSVQGQHVFDVAQHHEFVTDLEAPELFHEENSQFLQVRAQGFMPLGRDLYLGTGGQDVRAEEVVPAGGALTFAVAQGVKISTFTPDDISFTLAQRGRWHLRQRGGTFQLSEDRRVITLQPLRPDVPETLNWALRKLSTKS